MPKFFHYFRTQEPIAILDGKSDSKYQRYDFQSNTKTTFDAERKIFVVQYEEAKNRAVSVQLFQIMLDVANEIGHFYRHAATQ